MKYGYRKQVSLPFTEAVEKTRQELAKEGFGILTEIDVKAAFKEKLGVDYGNYIILGACNPSLAHKALEAEKEIGLLLPCNVIIYEDEGSVFVSSILPKVAMSMVESAALAEVADAAQEKLKKVIDQI